MFSYIPFFKIFLSFFYSFLLPYFIFFLISLKSIAFLIFLLNSSLTITRFVKINTTNNGFLTTNKGQTIVINIFFSYFIFRFIFMVLWVLINFYQFMNFLLIWWVNVNFLLLLVFGWFLDSIVFFILFLDLYFWYYGCW